MGRVVAIVNLADMGHHSRWGRLLCQSHYVHVLLEVVMSPSALAALLERLIASVDDVFDLSECQASTQARDAEQLCTRCGAFLPCPTAGAPMGFVMTAGSCTSANLLRL